MYTLVVWGYVLAWNLNPRGKFIVMFKDMLSNACFIHISITFSQEHRFVSRIQSVFKNMGQQISGPDD